MAPILSTLFLDELTASQTHGYNGVQFIVKDCAARFLDFVRNLMKMLDHFALESAGTEEICLQDNPNTRLAKIDSIGIDVMWRTRRLNKQ